MRRIVKLLLWPIYKSVEKYKSLALEDKVSQFAHFETTSRIYAPKRLDCPHKIYMYENTNINEGAIFIISSASAEGRFIMKKNSGAAANLTVITGNHQRQVKKLFKELALKHTGDIDKDVIVEEDVWLGANVTILAGVVVGRGATVAAGSVCIKSIPPYAIVMGNPAKIIGFNFNPEQVIEHENELYPPEERLPLETLEKNYEKYFINRIKEIKQFTKL